MPPRGQRQWPRIIFTDYPKQHDNSHIAGAESSNKVKVMCTACLQKAISVEIEFQTQAVANGMLAEVQNLRDIEAAVWQRELDKPKKESAVVSSHVSTMKTHVRDCNNVSQADRDRARQGSPSKAQRAQPYPTSHLHLTRTPSTLASGTPLPSGASALGTTFPLPFSDPQASAYNSPLAGPSISVNDTPSAFQQSLLFLAPSQHEQPDRGSIFSPSPLLPSSNIDIPLSRSNSLQGLATRPPSATPSSSVLSPLLLWNDSRQKEYKKALVRLTASAGFPLSWVENPEFARFVDTFIPGAPKVTRRSLTTSLRDVSQEYRFKAKESLRGKEATLQSDGWSGINNAHLNAFMVTSDKKVNTVKVNDSTKDRKVAEEFLKQIEDVYKELQDPPPNGWSLIVIALVTDASGEARKAKRLFSAKYPHVIVLDCYAHQVNLIVGDFFKSKTTLLSFTEHAVELITWLRSKTRVLGNLPYSVLRAVLTRWTSHYMAFRRLLQLYQALANLLLSDAIADPEKRVLVQGDAKARKKAEEMVAIIRSGAFWHALVLVVRYLEPLAIAANITQATFCRPDQVVLTLAFLVKKYNDPKMADDPIARDAILASINKRWAKADQEVFIATVMVNPFYRTIPFRMGNHVRQANIIAIMKRLYRRMYSVDNPPADFQPHLLNFLESKGIFDELDGHVRDVLANLKPNEKADPIALLNLFGIMGQPDSGSSFIRFARRLLSISANSASCERLFSVFGNTLTKQRNRLATSTLLNLSEVKMHVRDEHLAGGTKSRLKRHFQARAPPPDPEKPAPDPIQTRKDSRKQLEEIINSVQMLQPTPIIMPEPDPPQEGQPPPPPPPPREPDEFSRIVAHQIGMVDADENQNSAPIQEPLTSTSPWKPVSLIELFELDSAFWTTQYETYANLSFDEELELYDIVNTADSADLADAGGLEVTDFDAATEDILAK